MSPYRIALALTALLLAACSASEPSGVAPRASAGAPAAPVEGIAGQAVPVAQAERKLVYSADVELRAKDPWAVAEQARRIDYSRISVTINNVADITTASAWQPARTAAQALVTLVSLLKFLGDAVIWLVIVGWLPALLIAVFVYLRRLYRRRFPPRTPPVPPGPTPAPTAGASA